MELTKIKANTRKNKDLNKAITIIYNFKQSIIV